MTRFSHVTLVVVLTLMLEGCDLIGSDGGENASVDLSFQSVSASQPPAKTYEWSVSDSTGNTITFEQVEVVIAEVEFEAAGEDGACDGEAAEEGCAEPD